MYRYTYIGHGSLFIGHHCSILAMALPLANPSGALPARFPCSSQLGGDLDCSICFGAYNDGEAHLAESPYGKRYALVYSGYRWT